MTPEDMQERDIVEFTDDNGNTLMLEVMDYFYYNGQEFAALCNANENPGDDDPDDDGYGREDSVHEDRHGDGYGRDHYGYDDRYRDEIRDRY